MKRQLIKFAFFLTALVFASCKTDANYKNSVVGNKNIATEERNISAPFTKVHIQEGITLYLNRSDKQSMVVEADSNLLEMIKTEINNGVLKIHCEPNIKKSKVRNVHLSCNDLTEIKASSGSRVFTENTLISSNLNLSTSSGAFMDIQLNSNDLSAKSSSGSSLKVKGKASNATIQCSSGSSIDAYKLEAKEVDARASSGAHIKVYVLDKLNGKASSGGSINHKGKPKQIERKTSSGGNISAG